MKPIKYLLDFIVFSLLLVFVGRVIWQACRENIHSAAFLQWIRKFGLKIRSSIFHLHQRIQEWRKMRQYKSLKIELF